MFSTRHLQAFAVLAEHMHFGNAAKALGLSKSALSDQIRALEDELGAPVINRSNRTFTLTKAGEVFLPDARNILTSMELAKRKVTDLMSDTAGTVRIGLDPSTVSSGLYARILEESGRRFPGLSLEVSEEPSATMEGLLEKGELDCAVSVMLGLEKSGEFAAIPVASWQAVLIAHKDKQLTDENGSVNRRLFESEPFCIYRNAAENAPQAAVTVLGMTPKRILSFPSVHLIMSQVNAGGGIAMVPEPDLSMTGPDTRSVLLPGVKMEVCALRHRKNNSPRLLCFFEMLEEVFRGESSPSAS